MSRARAPLLLLPLLLALVAGAALLAPEPTPPAGQLPGPGPVPGASRPAPDATPLLLDTPGGAGPDDPSPGERPGPGAGDPSTGPDDPRGTTPGAGLPAWVLRVSDPDDRPLPDVDARGFRQPGQPPGELLGRSDRDGVISLPWPLPARWGAVQLEASGFARQVASPPEGPGQSRVRLLRARTLSGLVVSAEDGRTLAGVRLDAEAGSWFERAETDPSGAFRLAPPEGERALVRVSAAGRVATTWSEGQPLPIRLERGRSVVGRVLDPEGRPAAGATVLLFGADQLTSPQRGECDAAGRFTLAGLAPDEDFALLAHAPSGAHQGATPWELTWRAAGEAGQEQTVQLHPLGRLRVVGVPRDRELRLEGLAPDPLPQARRPEPDGAWSIAAPAGDYRLVSGELPIGPPVFLRPGEETQLSWDDLEGPAGPAPVLPETLPPGPVRLSVRVVDEGGQPVRDAVLVASGPSGSQEWPCDEAGRLVREGLPLEPLQLLARAPGRALRAPAFLDPEAQGPEAEVELVLARAVELEVLVAPPAPSRLQVYAGQGELLLLELDSDPQGRAAVTDLPAGPLVLEVTQEGRLPARLELTLPLPGPLRVELDADPRAAGHEHEHR